MPASYQVIQIAFIFVAFLAFGSGRQYLSYRTPIGQWGAGFLFVLAADLASYAMVWSQSTTNNYRFWYILSIISVNLLPILWFFFVNGFSNQPLSIDPRVTFTLLSLPVVFFAGALSITSSSDRLGEPASIFPMSAQLGGWASFSVIFLFVLLLLAAIRVFQLFVRQKTARDRRLFFPLIVGIPFLLGVTIIEWSGARVTWPISTVQISLALISISFYFYLNTYKLGGILPVGPASVFAVMRDGCIILDAKGRVTNLNPQAEIFLDCRRKDWVNKELAQVWPEVASIITERPTENIITAEITGGELIGDSLTQVLITRFIGINNTTTGRLVTIRNITGRDILEKSLVERNQVIADSNTLMQELAKGNLILQATSDLPAAFEALHNRFKNINLDFFIAKLDSQTRELTLSYASLHPEILARFEKITRLQIKGNLLQRSTFPELYSFLEADDPDYLSTTFQGNPSPARRDLPTKMIAAGLRAIGIDPETPLTIFRLSAGDHVIGLMGIWGLGMRQDNLNPLRIFSSQVAWAIERVDLYHREHIRTSELEHTNQLLAALANVSAQMGRSSESASALNVLGEEMKAIGLHCVLGSVDRAKETVVFQFASFIDEIKGFGKFVPGFHFIGYQLPKKLWPGSSVIQSGVPIWFQNVPTIFGRLFPAVPEKIFALAIARVGITYEDQLCILPLVVNGSVTGVMPVWGKNIGEKDTPALMVFAHQVAEFLHKTQGYEQEAARAENLARSNSLVIALSKVAASLETTSNLDDVFVTLGDELQKVHLNCMVGTVDRDAQFLKIEHLSLPADVIAWARKLGNLWPEEIIIPRRLWPTDKAITERAPVWDSDPIGSISRMFPLLPKYIFIKAFEMAGMSLDDQICYLPMVMDEDVVGILAVWGPDLKNDDIPALTVFSNQVASAIKSTTLYNHAQEEIITRREAEAKIQTALNEKEVLLREIHHRVKNNLQVVSSLLNLQAAQSKDPSYVEGLRESQNRVRAMALIHEKLYQSDDLARINFAPYMQGLVSFLSQTYRISQERVNIRLEIRDTLLGLDTAIPCGLIVNELVSNAMKYAFPDGNRGMITITCRPLNDGEILLEVADNGIGLPQGVIPAQSNSLGLKLVSGLVKQIDGTMSVESNDGLHYRIHFPLPA